MITCPVLVKKKNQMSMWDIIIKTIYNLQYMNINFEYHSTFLNTLKYSKKLFTECIRMLYIFITK